MSVAVGDHRSPQHFGPTRRRVRQEVRDALAVGAFSAAASTVLALAITLLVSLAG